MSQDCPICLRPISSPWVVCSPCGHPLHDECRRELINNGRGRQCPICNTHVRRFVKVYMDVSDPDPERIQQLEATAIECKEMSDHYMAEMIAREEDVCNLKNKLEKKDDLLSAKSERIRLLTKELNDKAVEIVTAVSNAQHFIRKLSARDIEIRELNAKLDETETVIEDIRSDLQYSIDEVISLKDAIFRLERQLQDKDVEIEKTCSSAAPAIRQMNALDKTIRQLQAKLKQQDDAWKMENELLHCVILALRFVFSLLEVLVLFLWIFDYGCEEQARRTVFSRQWYSSTGLYWILTPP